MSYGKYTPVIFVGPFKFPKLLGQRRLADPLVVCSSRLMDTRKMVSERSIGLPRIVEPFSSRSSEEVSDDGAFDIGEAHLSAGVAIGQLFVVKAE